MGGETTEMSDDHHARADRGRALGRRLDVPHRPAPQAHLRGRQAQRARRRPDHLRGRGRPGGRAARRVRRRHRSSPASPSSATPPEPPDRSRSRSTCPRASPGWTSPRTRPSPTSRPSAATVEAGADDARPRPCRPGVPTSPTRSTWSRRSPGSSATRTSRACCRTAPSGPRAHPGAVDAPPGRSHAGRRGLRRGAELPVRRGGRPRPARARRRRPPSYDAPAGQPAAAAKSR